MSENKEDTFDEDYFSLEELKIRIYFFKKLKPNENFLRCE
jgi:hypothetical protein